MKDHLIDKNTTLLEALTRINALAPEPLVLFVLDEQERMAKRRKEKMADEPEIKTVTVDDIPEILSKQIAMTNDVIAKQDSMRMLSQILGNQSSMMACFEMLYAKLYKED